jgi:hypothetical protein
MPNYIFPAVIDNRKAVLLDLVRNAPTDDVEYRIGEDIYVIEIPVQSKAIFSVAKNKSIQSLVNNKPDLSINDLSVRLSIENGKVVIEFQQDGQNAKFTDTLLELDCVSVQFEEDEDEMILLFEQHGIISNQTVGKFDVEIKLLVGNQVYSDLIRFHYAPTNQILLAGLDFGSEASQIVDSSVDNNTPRSFNLFDAIKKEYYPKYPDDDQYHQKERNNPNLYRSSFFCRNQIIDGITNFGDSSEIVDLSKNLNVITSEESLENANFFSTWKGIPNLKLIREGDNLGDHFMLEINGRTQSINHLTDPIYSGLLQGMIRSYIKTRVKKKTYLRFTLLVPNIYDIDKVNSIKKITRFILNEVNREIGNLILGAEISTLSESDASFLGCMADIKKKPRHYYIVIDSGKGTTDFSIISTDHGISFMSAYRNGFAGAGNLISFSIMQSVIFYLENISPDPDYKRKVRDFFKKKLSTSELTNFKNRFYLQIETWKRLYDPGLTREDVESKWESAQTGTDKLINLFSKEESLAGNTLLQLLKTLDKVYDWDGYISNSYNYIAEEIFKNLEFPIRSLNKRKYSCGGVFFTGRGFYFKPLRTAVKYSLIGINSIDEDMFVDTMRFDLKQICMQGIFNTRIITHSDIISTPVEVKAGTTEKIRKNNMISKLRLDRLSSFFNRFADIGYGEYSQEKNSVNILSKNMLNCQFLTGGNRYILNQAITAKMENAYLVQSRSGLYLIVNFGNEKTRSIKLTKDLGQNKAYLDVIYKSLFPGYSDSSLIHEKNING